MTELTALIKQKQTIKELETVLEKCNNIKELFTKINTVITKSLHFIVWIYIIEMTY